VFLHTPERGGHVGFYSNDNSLFWSEKRAKEFAKEMI
jgi:predicted alpha/beta-fold hydrolase